MATTTPDNEPSISMASEDVASRVRRIAPTVLSKVRRRLLPFLFLLDIVAYLDRINVGFAALQMNQALGFSATTYGLGAGMFFLSYVLFEIPSNVILARIGARLWIARIMITWGIVSSSMMFVRSPAGFHTLRFLLGAAEAGFFPGLIFYLTQWFPARERARTIAMFMTATLTAGVIGGPISGALLSLHGAAGLAGWQWLFLLEGAPAIALGFVVLRVLTDRPEHARWLADPERAALVAGAARAVSTAGTGIVWSIVTLSIAMIGLASMFGPFWALATTPRSALSNTAAAASIALVNSVGNTGGFVGPYLLGAINDATHSFAIGLYAIAAMMVAGAALVLTVDDR